MWNLPAPPGFQGLDPHKPVRVYMRHLPHWRQDGATYFVTFRLNDSLPRVKLDELAQVRTEWEHEHPEPREDKDLEELAKELMGRVEKWLDQGMGSCRLKQPAAAQLVAKAMHHFDGNRYELDCYVVMPNHVHAIVRPLTFELERILQGWKGYTSLEINRLYGLSGTFWQDESFDRIIRDEEHLYRAIQYIAMNPTKAGLQIAACPRWIRPEWVELGWRFEEG
jgi:putative transposase